jgi:hypothetical protein
MGETDMPGEEQHIPNIDRRHCGDHTGQDERIQAVNGKLTLLLWLLGILITIMMISIGALYTAVNSMNTTLAVVGQRSTGIESRLASMEAADLRRQEKIMALEYKK